MPSDSFASHPIPGDLLVHNCNRGTALVGFAFPENILVCAEQGTVGRGMSMLMWAPSLLTRVYLRTILRSKQLYPVPLCSFPL